MKKLFTFSAILLLTLLAYTPVFSSGKYGADNTVNFSYSIPGNIIPDVMGKYCVTLNDGQGLKNFTMQADSFPNLPGFPKHYTGTSFEGGIYCDMLGNGSVVIIYNIGFTIYALKSDGTDVPGWPKSVSPYQLQGAPAFGDIDGDGQGEVVVTSNNPLSTDGYLYAFKRDGTPVTGFPVNIGGNSRTPVLGDLDNNGHMKIIVNKRTYPTGLIFVYNGDGTIYPGWPKTINHVPASSAAVGDIDGDGQPEIIDESYISLYAWHKNGDSLPGFPYSMPNGDVNSYSSPVLADVNNDNYREIVFGTHNLSGSGRVYILKKDGTVLNNWPQSVGRWIYGPPIVGFVTGSSTWGVFVGDQTLSSQPYDFVYGWDINGNNLSGFPVGPLWAINDQIVLADINNDNLYELIFDDNTTDGQGRGKYLGYANDGTPLSGWPVYTTGTTFFNTPCILDALHNNVTDILGAGTESQTYTNLYLWNTGAAFNPSKIVNPMWQFNTRHNGVYGDIDLVGIKPVSNSIPTKLALEQNYPNPFNPVTKIKFDIPSNLKRETSNVRLAIYDVLGREVTVLVNQQLKPGSYKVEWDGSNFSSGVYFYRLTASDASAPLSITMKMMLVK